MTKASLLLVDDDQHILRTMGDWLEGQGYQVDTARGQQEALRALENGAYDVALVDIRLEDGDGFEILSQARRTCPDTWVILISGYGTVELAMEAVRQGAFDFLTKPLIDDELEMVLQRALSQRRVVAENKQLRAQLDLRFGMDNIVGHDHRMQRVFDLIESVAEVKTTVLITGESGTGKSMIARAIHRRSPRRDKPFVEVACGALPETLLESELFGHAAGSFTGAIGDRIGKFTQADGGTIFLDEIGTASPGLQVKLLRVLQDFEFEPVGSTRTHKVDARVILATNENLADLVAKGKFRQDLYYRINVINIELPPLRERISDIPHLARYFLQRIREEAGKPVEGFTEAALAALQRYHWLGNVRELQNVVERAVLLGKRHVVDVDDLPSVLAAAAPLPSELGGQGPSLKSALAVPERQIILEVLKEHNWNRNQTAEALGINRTTLYKKMKKLGLQEPSARSR